MKATTVLVTGGAGFIGSNLVRHLEEHGRRVRVIDDFSTGLPENLDGLNASVVHGSILESSVLERAMQDVDAVVHLAARPSVPRSIQDPMASHHANATGTLAVLEAARLGSRPYVVVASSSSVYGANPALPKRESDTPMPVSPYAVSKLATESYTLAYRACFGLEALAFRFFNVYGPGQRAGHSYAAVVPAFVDAAIRGLPLPVDGDGTQSRDFTYVGSVVRIIARAVTERVSPERPLNLAFGTRSTLNDLIGAIESIWGSPVERVRRPSRAGDVPASQADDTQLKLAFPGEKPVPLMEGLRATIEWHVSTSGASPTR